MAAGPSTSLPSALPPPVRETGFASGREGFFVMADEVLVGQALARHGARNGAEAHAV